VASLWEPQDVGLGERTRHFPHELSGGGSGVWRLPAPLAAGSEILLADEPTGELDFKTVQILQLLARTGNNGQNCRRCDPQSRISRMAGRVIELSSGCIASDAPPRVVKPSPNCW
jgi:putative ABC transport system ATP-binding protein